MQLPTGQAGGGAIDESQRGQASSGSLACLPAQSRIATKGSQASKVEASRAIGVHAFIRIDNVELWEYYHVDAFCQLATGLRALLGCSFSPHPLHLLANGSARWRTTDDVNGPRTYRCEHRSTHGAYPLLQEREKARQRPPFAKTGHRSVGGLRPLVRPGSPLFALAMRPMLFRYPRLAGAGRPCKQGVTLHYGRSSGRKLLDGRYPQIHGILDAWMGDME